MIARLIIGPPQAEPATRLTTQGLVKAAVEPQSANIEVRVHVPQELCGLTEALLDGSELATPVRPQSLLDAQKPRQWPGALKDLAGEGADQCGRHKPGWRWLCIGRSGWVGIEASFDRASSPSLYDPSPSPLPIHHSCGIVAKQKPPEGGSVCR